MKSREGAKQEAKEGEGEHAAAKPRAELGWEIAEDGESSGREKMEAFKL